MSENDTVRERVNRLLDGAEGRIDALLAPETGTSDGDGDADADGDADERDELLELADEASDLVETSDASELLEAFDLADGDGRRTIPEAIASGEGERVADLRTLLKLANLSRTDENEFRDATAMLRDAIDRGRTSSEERDGGESDSGEDGSDAEADTSDGGDLESTVRSAVSGFRDELEGLRDHLGDAGGDGGGSAVAESIASGGDESETEEQTGTGSESESEPEPEPEAADESTGGRSGRTSVGSSRGSIRHSTMPPAKRPDMGRATRHSTMPPANK